MHQIAVWWSRWPGSNIGAAAGVGFDVLDVDVADLDSLPAALHAALATDGPAVVSVECLADELPPFAPFLTRQSQTPIVPQEFSATKEERADVAASA